LAHHNTVLAQLLKLLPRHEFEKLANRQDGKRKASAMTRWSQFVALTIGHLGGRSSLRDIEATVQSQSHLNYHLGSQAISRSALGRTNERLGYHFFEALFQALYQRCAHAAPGHTFRFKKKLFSLDASLIDVSMKIFPKANYNRMKAAFKLHVGLDHDGLIPAFATLTAGKVSDMTHARSLQFPKGSVVVFDKGYNSYEWHNQLTEQGVFFVTRIRGNAKYRVLERRAVDTSTGITSDQTIEYTSVRASRMTLTPVRRVGFRDPETGKHYVFVTNQFDWCPKTIADIYKQRWQVELFFKWIKQNLKIKAFLGTSDNAVMTQVMAALCLYLLLSYLKFTSKLGRSLQQITRLLQMNLFSRRSLLGLLRPLQVTESPPPQLCLGLTRI